MYPARFEYHAPGDLEEAVGLLRQLGPEAKLLAGGCSLIPLMKLRLAEPPHLVDLRKVPGLAHLAEEDGWLRLGALTTEAEIERSQLLARSYPILVDASSVIADPTVRNMGTVGGNLAHADPANDHPAVMVALGAELVARGPDGERTISIDDFFLGLFETAMDSSEVLTEIRVPVPAPGSGSAYVKFERQVGDYAIAGAAACVRLADGLLEEAKVALTNLGDIATRAGEAERMLLGRAPDDETLRAASEASASELSPWDDLRASAEVKLKLASVAMYRALGSAVRRAQGGLNG